METEHPQEGPELNQARAIDIAARLREIRDDLFGPHGAQFMADAQVPWGLAGAVQYKLPKAAWKARTIHYMLTLEDHMIPPSLQRMMATRAKAQLVEIHSSHAVMLSHPDKVVEFIEAAVPAK